MSAFIKQISFYQQTNPTELQLIKFLNLFLPVRISGIIAIPLIVIAILWALYTFYQWWHQKLKTLSVFHHYWMGFLPFISRRCRLPTDRLCSTISSLDFSVETFQSDSGSSCMGFTNSFQLAGIHFCPNFGYEFRYYWLAFYGYLLWAIILFNPN